MQHLDGCAFADNRVSSFVHGAKSAFAKLLQDDILSNRIARLEINWVRPLSGVDIFRNGHRRDDARHPGAKPAYTSHADQYNRTAVVVDSPTVK